MNDANRQHSPQIPEQDKAMVHLLRLAGSRPEVPADAASRVRNEVHRQWQAGLRRRAVGRRALAATALLATAAALIVGVRLKTARDAIVAPVRESVATIERTEGIARLSSGTSAGGSVPTALSPGDTVRRGDQIETGSAAHAVLRLLDGTSVRLDAGSRARLLSSTVVELTSGGLYFDTGRDSTGLEVRTPLGTVHDIGTQFEIRLDGPSLRLRVRTGVVELRRADRSIPARAGTELTVAAGKAVTRPVSTYGPEWDWVTRLAPAFAIEGRSLAAFLEHLSHERGWMVRYADAALARDASSIILHGSVNDLQPQEALAVAMTTSGLRHRLRDGVLFVFRGNAMIEPSSR